MEKTSLYICGGPAADDLRKASAQVESWKTLGFRVVGGFLQFEKSRWVVVHLEQVKQRRAYGYLLDDWDCTGVVTSGEFEANGINLVPGIHVRIWYVDSKHIGSIYLLPEVVPA